MKRLLKSFNKMSKQRRAVTGFALAAVVLLAGISVKQTLAYFTTYATARGGVPITVGPTTTVRKIQKLAENHTNRKYRRC